MSKNRELGVNMLDLVEILVRRKRFILAVAFAGALAAAIYSLVVDPQYEANVVLMPPQGSSENGFGRILKGSPIGKIGGVGKLLSAAPSDLTNAYLAILGSRTIRMNLVHEFNLLHVYKFDKSKHYYIEDVLKKVDKNLSVSIDRDVGTISVSVKDKNPKRAADMANFIASQLDETYKQQTIEKQHDLRVFLGERLRLVRVDLETAEKNVLNFQKQHNITDAE
ncbi:MAG TPA: Wzz/FepE/Etk N-terminal domain-containing protein, partial [Fibrobacteria bacterium]|nr:Wzz/FepE/Etk N-terminal domain-containing protein [Fibrobacteria bacterium]